MKPLRTLSRLTGHFSVKMSYPPIDGPHEREKNRDGVCTVRRKTFAASEADTRSPECKIGSVRIMEHAA